MFFKIGVLKNFAIFKGKHLSWSLFLIKLQAFTPATLFKRDSYTGVFLWILRLKIIIFLWILLLFFIKLRRHRLRKRKTKIFFYFISQQFSLNYCQRHLLKILFFSPTSFLLFPIEISKLRHSFFGIPYFKIARRKELWSGLPSYCLSPLFYSNNSKRILFSSREQG